MSQANVNIVDMPTQKSVKYPDTITTESGGRILNTRDNLLALGRFLGVEFTYNVMIGEPEVRSKSISFDEYLGADQMRSFLLSESAKNGLPRSAIDDHFTSCCASNRVHPIKEILNGRVWDGVNRVDDVLECMNAKLSNYSKDVLRKFLVGAVAAVYEKHFKLKLVPVLQGEQSFMKTALIERIFSLSEGAFLEGADVDPRSKDSVMKVVTTWCCEVGELERTSARAQGDLKAFFGNSQDSYRPPYGKSVIRKPRQTVYIGTVNGSNFLTDETGSVRYAVIELSGKVKIDEANKLLGYSWDGSDAKLINKELLIQFWLEIKSMYESGYGWVLSDSTLQEARNENIKHQAITPFRDIIMKYFSFSDGDAWYTSGDICEACGINAKDSSWVGRDLTAMANEGLTVSKQGSGRRKLYWLRQKNPSELARKRTR